MAVPPNAGPRAVILNDGTIARGRFQTLNLGVVETDAGELDRDDVALIVLEPPVRAVPPPPTPTPPPPPPPSVGRGALWTGTMRAHLRGDVDGVHSDLVITADVRLREYPSPWLEAATGKRIGTFTRLMSEGSTLKNTYRCRAEGMTCSGEGTVTVTTGPADLQPNAIYFKEREGRADFDVPVGRALYVAGVPPPNGAKYTVTYRTDVASESEMGYIAPLAGRHPVLPAGPLSDPQFRFIENGRMSGSYTIPASGAFTTMDVSWSICREAAQCTPAPPLPGEGTPAALR